MIFYIIYLLILVDSRRLLQHDTVFFIIISNLSILSIDILSDKVFDKDNKEPNRVHISIYLSVYSLISKFCLLLVMILFISIENSLNIMSVF